MRTLCVHFQSRRARAGTLRAASILMAEVAASMPHVRTFEIRRFGRWYANFLFTSTDLRRTWEAVRTRVLANRRLGPALRSSTIVVAEGSRKWDNYLLLHHFDEKEILDTLRTSRGRRSVK
jgi:hypothetical protein